MTEVPTALINIILVTTTVLTALLTALLQPGLKILQNFARASTKSPGLPDCNKKRSLAFSSPTKYVALTARALPCSVSASTSIRACWRRNRNRRPWPRLAKAMQSQQRALCCLSLGKQYITHTPSHVLTAENRWRRRARPVKPYRAQASDVSN